MSNFALNFGTDKLSLFWSLFLFLYNMKKSQRTNTKHHLDNNNKDENFSLKPHQHDQQKSNLDSSSSVSISTSLHKTHNHRTHKRNPKWVPRNQSNYASNQWSIKKSELNSSNSELGSKITSLESPNSKTESFLESEVGSLIDDGGCLSFSERVENKEENGGVEMDKKAKDCEEKNGVVDDVMSVLKELQLGVIEPELSEEQLRINDQAQEDELLVMESIYGENVVILDRQNGLRCFQIHLQVGDPCGLTITAKLNAVDNFEASSDEFSYSFKVQYLPPVTLTCLLPKSYPSHLPPYFTLSVKWLDIVRVSSLCSMLDSLWTQQSGQEIMYHWTEWLQNFSLSHLGVDDDITLGPYGMKYNGDKRAVSGSVSMDSDVPFLKSYNDEQCYDNFRQNMHECPICYSEYAGSDFIWLPCKHFFCKNCMKIFCNMHVSEGTVNQIQCPDAKCKGMVPPNLLKQLLDEKEYERWESLTLQKSLESMSDVLYCPRCETPCIADDDQHAQCSKCFFSFCTVCGQKRHVGEECLTPELRLRILEERQNSSVLKGDQMRKVQDMINEMRSITAILSDAKQCPSCKMAISKTEGCNKMICENCGQYFCYRCNSAIKGYDHFRDSECELFPGLMLQQWEQQMMNPGLVMAPQHQNGIPVSCPFCGQRNAKVNNNNHILCWACQHHFCYLCKQIVKRSSQHYGPKGCKQHTEG